jgi:hypothetical protein
MLTLQRRKYLLRVAEAYFYTGQEESLPRVDVVFLVQSSVPLGASREFRTLHLDLTLGQAELFSRCSRSTQYQIRRARERDGLTFQVIDGPSEQQVKTFIDFYDEFAAIQGLERCDTDKLEALRRRGGLNLAFCKDQSDVDLCWHANITDGRRARMLHSASFFREAGDKRQRALLGRANRGLHWVEIETLKEKGYRTYDLGGFAPDSEDPVIRSISRFKSSFGGEPTTEFHCTVARTLAGKVALSAQQALRAFRRT